MGGWFVYTFNMQPDGNTPTNKLGGFPRARHRRHRSTLRRTCLRSPQQRPLSKSQTRVLDRIRCMQAFRWGMPDPRRPGVGVPSFTLKPCLSLSSTTEDFLLITLWRRNALGLYHITEARSTRCSKKSLSSRFPIGPPPDGVQLGCSAATNAKIKSGDARTQDPVWRDGYLYATHTIGLNIDTGHFRRFVTIK